MKGLNPFQYQNQYNEADKVVKTLKRIVERMRKRNIKSVAKLVHPEDVSLIPMAIRCLMKIEHIAAAEAGSHDGNSRWFPAT